MSEERMRDLNGDSTNPLPLEELLKRHFDVVMMRLDQLETQFNTRFDRVEKDVQDLKLDSQGIKSQFFKVEDRIRDLDDKVGAFVRESLYLKRELREVQTSLKPEELRG